MSNTKPYTPFSFGTSFDELEKSDLQVQDEQKKRDKEDEIERVRLEEEAKEAPPPPPSFSEEELAEAKAAAWEEGRQSGVNDTLGGIEQQTMVALQTLTGHFAILQDRQSLANESQAASLSRIASEMVRKMMPIYASEHGVEEIKSLVYASLAPLETKGRVNISIPDTLNEVLQAKLDDVQEEAGFEGKVVYIPDARLGLSDVKIDWGRGSAERNVEQALKEMDGVIEQFLENHLKAEELDPEEAKHDLVDEAPVVAPEDVQSIEAPETQETLETPETQPDPEAAPAEIPGETTIEDTNDTTNDSVALEEGPQGDSEPSNPEEQSE